MGRGIVLGIVAAAAVVAACGAIDNSYQGDETFSGNANAWYVDYPESEGSDFVSAIDAPAFGVALGTDRATVAMNDMTCGVHLDSGSVFFDLDMRAGEIQDGVAGEPGNELTSLLVAAPLVTLVSVDQPLGGEQFLVRGIRQARLLDASSFVALSNPTWTHDDPGACELRWFEDGELSRKAGANERVKMIGGNVDWIGHATRNITG